MCPMNPGSPEGMLRQLSSLPQDRTVIPTMDLTPLWSLTSPTRLQVASC